jgi:hypothetical protein
VYLFEDIGDNWGFRWHGRLTDPLWLAWAGALTELSWANVLSRGFPLELADLSRELGQFNERPIRVFTLPTLEAAVEGLAAPFVHDDGILFDPSLLARPGDLTTVVALALSHLLYPGWSVICQEDSDEMHAFAALLAPRLVRWLPSTVDEVKPMVAATVQRLRAA